MKLLEFLEVIREDDSSEPGKFVGARLTRESEKQLMHWMRETGLRKKQPRKRLHITVIGDPTHDFDWIPATFDPPLEVDASSYKLKRFGGENECVVLVFSCPELEERHHKARKYHGIHWDHDHYQPHITISVDPTELNNIDDLLLPTFPLYIEKEYEQPWVFNANESELTERRHKQRTDEEFMLFERNVLNPDDATAIAREQIWNAMNEFPPEVVEWATKALRKYIINDAPMPAITGYDPQNRNAQITYPNAPETWGIISNSERNKELDLPRWAVSALGSGGDLYLIDRRGAAGSETGRQVMSIRDWLRNLRNNNRLNVGRLSRMSWAQAVQAAEEFHRELAKKRGEDSEELEGDKTVYLDLGENGTWWKLVGKSCLDREGNLMGHCVADYIDQVESGESIILSLRDKSNKPHVTVELAPFRYKDGQGISIEQVKGKENEPPVPKYQPQVISLLKKLKQDYPEVRPVEMGEDDLGAMGIFKVPDGGPFIRVTNKHEGEDDPLKWRIKVRRDYLTKDDNDDTYPGDYNSTVGKFAQHTYDSPYTVIANIAYHGEHKTEGVIEDETAESMYAWSDEVIA